VVEFVFGHFAAKGVAVYTEKFGGARLITVGAIEDPLDEALLKFANRLIEEDATLDHLQYQAF
jgi:hypothetical protein